MNTIKAAIRVDVWADVVCPFCYVGEARLEAAAAALADEAEITIVPHAYQLDPGHTHAEPILDSLARKYGRSVDEVRGMDARVAAMAVESGLPYSADRVTANTLDCHRLIAAAAEFGVALAALSALQRAHFSGDLDLNDMEAVIATVVSVGLPQARARQVLASDEYADAVAADVAQARQMGVTGVPFVVVDRRIAIPGAAAPEQYEQVLRSALS